MPQRSFDDFDDYAKDYRSIHTDNIKFSGADSFYFAEMKVKLLKYFALDYFMKVLDIGCGDGTTGVFMAKHFPQWSVTGIDVSNKSVEEAKSKNIPSAEFLVYDGNQIPFEDKTFDIIFMAGVLHHVDFGLHQNIIKEVNRVTKVDGRFFLFEHNPINPLTRHLVNTCVFDKDAKLLKSNYALQLLQNNKFKIIKKQFIIFFPRKKIFTPFIFLERFLKWLPLGGQYFIFSRKRL